MIWCYMRWILKLMLRLLALPPPFATIYSLRSSPKRTRFWWSNVLELPVRTHARASHQRHAKCRQEVAVLMLLVIGFDVAPAGPLLQRKRQQILNVIFVLARDEHLMSVVAAAVNPSS
ncbi:unnamed protein product [Ceratitis capitata]|uniref:(Mediterranean fruit fly) hypothetical protein n=1 Tax=Ceratitis capitata TaxID=7213 RepID=A0A811U8N9_CERCA|nr:unnamed protein product [Ceratitis capitata]